MLLLPGCGCSSRPITSLAICIQHEMNRTCQQPKPSFAWTLPIICLPYAILFFQSLINADSFIPV